MRRAAGPISLSDSESDEQQGRDHRQVEKPEVDRRPRCHHHDEGDDAGDHHGRPCAVVIGLWIARQGAERGDES